MKKLVAHPLLAGCLVVAAFLPAAAQSSQKAEEAFFEEHFERLQVLARNHQQVWHEGIPVTGTEDFVGRLREALALIEEVDSREWYFVRKHIRKITLTGHSGIDVVSGRLMSGPLGGEDAATIAGGIVHEAWHRELHYRGEPWQGEGAERLCLAKQNAFLARSGAPQLDVDETLASGYWLVDYWSRDW